MLKGFGTHEAAKALSLWCLAVLISTVADV